MENATQEAAADVRSGFTLGKTSAEKRFDELASAQPERMRKSWEELNLALKERRIDFGGTPLPTNLKPHFIPAAVHSNWARRTEQFTALLEKLAAHLVKSPDMLRSLGFDERALELFAIDPGLDRAAFSARPDGLWKGEVLKFVEFNSDSPAMMTYSDHVQDIQRKLFPMTELGDEFEIEFTDRTRVLFEAVIDAYRQSGGDKSDPTIAIVDWAGQMTADELRHTGILFEGYGCPSMVCDPGELSIRDGRLIARGKEIDIVQRRVLFPEFIERYDELTALLTAYRERHAVLVNPLRSYLVGSKGILALLHQKCGGILSEEEVALAETLVPMSRTIDDACRADLRNANRDEWVLKPAFGHGGYNVVIGSALSQQEWLEALEQTKGGFGIAQERITIPQYDLPIDEGGSLCWRAPFINWTPWVFGGRFAGGTSRCSANQKVSITQRGALLPAVAAK